MLDDFEPDLTRSWSAKFGDAFRGVREEIRGQRSFRVHFAAAVAVIVSAAALRVTLPEWCVLLMCITGVLVAEMFNTAMEALAKAITHNLNRHIALALDIAGAAVLVASIGSALVGGIIFVNRLGLMLQWW